MVDVWGSVMCGGHSHRCCQIVGVGMWGECLSHWTCGLDSAYNIFCVVKLCVCVCAGS